jgi:hypothetical protein
MNYWLKSLGTHDSRIASTGLASISWVTDDIGFPRNPTVKPGDRLVLYASGHQKIFGVVEVNLRPQLDNNAKPWSYRVRVSARLVIDSLARAPSLDVVSDGSRNIRKSIQQQSHIQLSQREYDAAVAALEEAVDEAAGDLLRLSFGRV